MEAVAQNNNNFLDWQTEEIIEWIEVYSSLLSIQSKTSKKTYDKAIQELQKRKVKISEIKE